MKNKGKFFTSVSVGTAAVWFSTHCGAGFASGTQELQFFSNHGWFGPLMPILSMILLAITYYVGLETARQTDKWSYDLWSREAFAPYPTFFSWMMEICIIVTSIAATAASIAAGATLVNQYTGAPIVIGSLVMFAIITLLCIFGAQLVRKNAMIMTSAILIIISIVIVAGLIKFGPDIARLFGEGYVNPDATKWTLTGDVKGTTEGNLFNSILWALTYTGFQFAAIGSYASAFKGAQSRNETKGAMILGTIINVIMLSGICLLIFSHMPEIYINEQAKLLPTVYIVNQLNIPVLGVLYPILLFLALITTGVGFTFGMVQRFSPMLKGNLFKTDTSKNAFISIAYLVICVLVSSLGLMWVVATAYKYSGIFSWIFLIIPLWILGFKNIRKRDKNNPSLSE